MDQNASEMLLPLTPCSRCSPGHDPETARAELEVNVEEGHEVSQLKGSWDVCACPPLPKWYHHPLAQVHIPGAHCFTPSQHVPRLGLP